MVVKKREREEGEEDGYDLMTCGVSFFFGLRC